MPAERCGHLGREAPEDGRVLEEPAHPFGLLEDHFLGQVLEMIAATLPRTGTAGLRRQDEAGDPALRVLMELQHALVRQGRPHTGEQLSRLVGVEGEPAFSDLQHATEP